MNFDVHSVLQTWSTPVALDVALCVGILIYVRGWFRLRAVSPNLIPAWCLAAFLGGIASIWIAIGSPLEAFDDLSLSVHMIQHLLLMAIAPPLILLGAPELPLLHGLPQTFARRVVGPILRWGVLKSLASFLTNLAVAWLAAALTLIVWHIPPVFGLALRSNALHVFEHATFFVAGLIFWWPVIQPWPSVAVAPRWIIPLYLFFATLPCDALSALLAFCDRVVYPAYLVAPRAFDISPLYDQQRAAAIMWVCVTIIYLVPAVGITLQILSPQRQHPTSHARENAFRGPRQPLDGSKMEASQAFRNPNRSTPDARQAVAPAPSDTCAPLL